LSKAHPRNETVIDRTESADTTGISLNYFDDDRGGGVFFERISQPLRAVVPDAQFFAQKHVEVVVVIAFDPDPYGLKARLMLCVRTKVRVALGFFYQSGSGEIEDNVWRVCGLRQIIGTLHPIPGAGI